MWKRAAYTIGGGLEMTTLVGAVPLRGAAMLTQKTVYQIGRSALSRTARKESYRASAKAATIAERKLLGQTASNATTRRVETALAKESVALDLDALSYSGQVMDRSGLTRAGRALDKHGNRSGSIFPKASGNTAVKNAQGQFCLDDILTHPSSTIQRFNRPRYGGEVIDIQIPGGQGARYSQEWEFIGFLNP